MQRTKTGPTPASRTRFASLLLCLLAALAAAFVLSAPGEVAAQGEDDDYVDVAVVLEVAEETTSTTSQHINIIVMNQGSRIAYDVEVVVDVESPEDSYYVAFYPTYTVLPIGSVSLENNERSFRWSIPALRGLQRAEISGVKVAHLHTTDPNLAFDNRLIPHEYFGEVTTSSFESHLHQGNNTSRIWSYRYSASNAYYRQAAGNYTVAVSVDEHFPSPGDTVNFTIAADIATPTDYSGIDVPPIDTKVDIELTGGLTVSGTPTYASGALGTSTVPDSVNYSNGVFNIGTLTADDVTKHSVTLPVTVSSNAVVNEQCLTATVTGNPPPGAGPLDDDISDNVAKVYLAQTPPYFTSADLQEFVSHSCVGDSDHPCDNTDDVRVRAIDTTTDPAVVLGPGTPVIHVPDTSETRKYDSDTDSVNTGDKVSWQVPVQISLDPFTSEHERWTDYSARFSYEMPGKAGSFDKLHIRVSWGNALLNNEQREATFLATYDPIGTSGANGPFDLIAEFEKLGTYKVHHSTTLTHDNNTVTDTSDDVDYSATGSYIFHVGPMTDLEVRDGGASPHVVADQNALTIVVANNGPFYSPDTQVTGLPTGASVIHISQGTYDGTTGEWDIGELKVRGYYRSAGEPDPTLVLSASTGDTADVTVANSEHYEVCVGPNSNPVDLALTTESVCEAVTDASWNSTPVYDYDDGNNMATITAQAGTGGVGEGAPDLRGAEDSRGSSITVTWDAVDYVNGVPVTHYEVQRQTNPWVTLANDVQGTEYVDTDVDPATHSSTGYGR